jgi:protein phosphatase
MKMTPFVVKSYGLTDVGLVREKNEDVFAICKQDSLFVLADGMGGHRAGDVAAKAAVHGLCAILKDAIISNSGQSAESLAQEMKKAFTEVNRITYRMGQQDPYLKGMGTTLLCLLLLGDHAILGHIGDSRIYLFRDQKLTQMTQDHSLMRELMDMGQLKEEEIEGFMYKNILTRAIGTENQVEASIQIEHLSHGDTYLLCSDGLTDHLSLEDLQAIFLNHSTPEKIAKQCMRIAKERGGHDNITLLIVQVE